MSENSIPFRVDQNSLPDYLPEAVINYLYNNSRDGFAICSAKAEILECNDMLASFLQCDKQELIGRNVEEFSDPLQYRIEVEKYLKEQLFVKGYSERYEKELIAQDGNLIPVEVNLFAIRDKEQQIVGWWATIRDIRDRKMDIQKLKASENLLKLTQQIALVGGWEYDLIKDQLIWTDQTYQIHEVDENFQPDFNNALDFFDAKSSAVLRFATEELMRTGQNYELSVPMTTAMGNKKYVECIGKAEKDFSGRIVKIYGTIQDISKEKAYEHKLNQSREQYRSLQENLPVGVFRTNENGAFLSVNEELVKISGAESKDDLYSRNVLDFYFLEDERQKLLEIINTEGIVKNYPVLVKRIDNSIFRGAVSARLIRDQQEGYYYDTILRDVTAQYEAEKAIKESEEKFKSLYNSIKDAILVADTDRRIIECNKGFTSTFGYELDEIKHKQTSILYDNVEEFHDVTDKLQLRCSTQPVYFKINYKKKTGEVFPAETGIFHLKNAEGEITGYVASIRDVTDKHQAELKLKKAFRETSRQNKKNKALLKGARALLLYNDFKKMAEVLFESCRELLGVESGYMALINENQSHYELPLISYNNTSENDLSSPIPLSGLRAEAVESAEVVFENNFAGSENRKMLPKGHLELKNVLIAPMIVKEKPVGIIGLANKKGGFTVDDAETARAFADLAALAFQNNKVLNDLIESKDKAEHADKIKTAFISNISHEIRTPMNAIIGFSDFLSEPDIDENERDSYIQTIQDNGEVLMQIIDDILDISRIEAGELRINKKKVEVSELLKSVFESTLKGLYKKSGKELDLKLNLDTRGKEIIINTDTLRFKQIFGNLLSNALKFTKDGSVEMGCEVLKDKHIRFYVKDTGIGIAREKQKEIFERFRQADDSNTRTFGGIGIGLTITKNLIELLGAEIKLDSEPGIGSEFYFILPYEKEVETKQQSNGSDKKSGFIDLKGKTVLIAEDVDSNFHYLNTLLKIFNAKVLRAENGKEAVELIRQNDDICLVLMDIQMPELNGLDATNKIRKFNPYVPVIAQTAFASPEDEELCLSNGCTDYISKPIKASQLINIIKKHLDI